MVQRSLLQRNALEAVDLYCRKANARTLKRLALFIGAAQGTNKSTSRENILFQAAFLEELRKRKEQNNVVSVLAIDAGIANFAFARFSWASDQKLPLLLDWNKIQLKEKFMPENRYTMTLNPRDTSDVIYNLTEYLTTELPVPDAFTIERQRARSMSSKTILEPILKVNILEQVLFSNLENKIRFNQGLPKLNYMVASSDPQRMTSYWCSLTPTRKALSQNFPEDSEESKLKMNSNRLSKSIKINLVKRLLEGAVGLTDEKLITLTPDWSQRLKSHILGNRKFKLWDCAGLGPKAGARKDDDLADAFLHGLAWMEWLRAYEEVRNIVLKEKGKYDQNVLADFNEYCKKKKVALEKFQEGTSNRLTELEPPEEDDYE
ncbi:hypothetical protein HG536_0G00370 [Torulaspora globosa]|uniref:Mitochondrial resolvase Ydc2 catalytic domain-containing protein n=1 Tax=Torulaspora globosa TaxID=48254 RepID=A0A7G3ZKZ4_9SACH|nr:uncharacterized protein HG536_0G00370 [Torulaspora globosa]QLL34180.1 hypothetical protein HG536_0G00370 [Torulaspora globosa]